MRKLMRKVDARIAGAMTFLFDTHYYWARCGYPLRTALRLAQNTL